VDLEDERRFGSVYYKPVVVGLYGDQVEVGKYDVMMTFVGSLWWR
jgi:hypothetical protein